MWFLSAVLTLVLAACYGPSTVEATFNRLGRLNDGCATGHHDDLPDRSSIDSCRRRPTIKQQQQQPLLARQQRQRLQSGSCVTCNNSDTCCSGEECCSGGSFCCSNTSSCCQDTCCDRASESCCPDPINGGVCCEKETTFCCPPQPNLDHPSRCCPRWYVCCDYGRYGCCDPQTGTPMEENVAYGLFLEPTWIGPMVFRAATIDLASGTRTEVPVTGFHTEQETTRTFMFDKYRSVFMLLQANFTDPVNTSTTGYPIHLFTIDPKTGNTTVQLVAGAQDEVTGYRLLDGGSSDAPTVLFATWWYAEGAVRRAPPTPRTSGKVGQQQRRKERRVTTVHHIPSYAREIIEDATREENDASSGEKPILGYLFYTLDVTTAVATLVARHKLSVPGQDNYAGWFHEAAPDASRVYRLDFENVVTSANFGMSTTMLDAASKSTKTSFLLVPRPDGTHGHYRSLNILFHGTPTLENGGEAAASVEPIFLSLAPTYNETRAGDLSLFTWKLSDPFNSPRKVANFSNAHTVPYFGPIAEALSADNKQYVTAVVQDSILGNDYDTWGIGIVDLGKPLGSSSKEFMLSPEMVAVTVSVSGVGIPAKTSARRKPNSNL